MALPYLRLLRGFSCVTTIGSRSPPGNVAADAGWHVQDRYRAVLSLAQPARTSTVRWPVSGYAVSRMGQ